MKICSPGILGIFSHLGAVVQAIQNLRKAGFKNITVYSPIPSHEIDKALEGDESPIRVFTLVGGIIGCITGFALTISTSLDWPLIVGGKPIVSIPPYVIIAFELTILFGALATLFGFLFKARLLRIKPEIAYDIRFSEDRFGIFVHCDKNQISTIEKFLFSAGAEEVFIEGD